MSADHYYNQETHGPFERHELGDFQLEDGGTLHGAHLAYTTHGKLNPAKDNAILIPTWYSGTTKIWEQVYIGKGRALDPEKYFIIGINQFGNGLSSSPHNTPAPYGRGNFPHVRISDDVRAQHRLVTEKFGLTQLALVVGGSMGAQQTYEWAVRYPDMVKRAAPIAGTAKNTDHDFIFTQTLCDAITDDPAWEGGWYADRSALHRGLRRHAQLWDVMGWSTEFFKQEYWRRLGFSSARDFQLGVLEAYFQPMDANNLLCMGWKWQHGDVSRITGGDLAAALGRIEAKVFVMPISHDMFFVAGDCEYERQLIPAAELRVLQTITGHFGLIGIDGEFLAQVDRHLQELLAIPV